MADDDIFEKINKSINSITNEDIESWIISGLNDYFSKKINSLAYRAYGKDITVLSRAAFVEHAKNTILNATKTFFRLKRWEVGKNLCPYLHLSLKRLAERIYWDNSSAKRTSVLICPACRLVKKKVILVEFGDLWQCQECSRDLENNSYDQLKKAFALHSKYGYRCPELECSGFIPESLNTKYGIFCPYPECSFSGNIDHLEKMSHPCTVTSRKIYSLDSKTSDDDDSGTFQDYLEANIISADDAISVTQSYSNEYRIMMDVIEKQSASVKRANSKGTAIQKLLMYEAFTNICKKMPHEMISYLVHMKHNNPVQSKIFQEYISLIIDALPFSIDKNSETFEIMSATDPELGLFYGESVFQTKVEPGGIIQNKTIETYVGGRKMKCFGPCFIGKIVDLFNLNTNEILLDKIKEYSFVRILMDETVPVGTEVVVSHWRIPSHYELGHMVFLQRIRRAIVDKIYFRLNGTKRLIDSE